MSDREKMSTNLTYVEIIDEMVGLVLAGRKSRTFSIGKNPWKFGAEGFQFHHSDAEFENEKFSAKKGEMIVTIGQRPGTEADRYRVRISITGYGSENVVHNGKRLFDGNEQKTLDTLLLDIWSALRVFDSLKSKEAKATYVLQHVVNE